jgi:hypothetical protein
MKDQTTNSADLSKINPETVLAYGQNFTFHVDDQSRNNLVLEVEDSELRSSTMRIPIDVWHAIHQCGLLVFSLSPVSDEHLRAMSVATVETRKNMIRAVNRFPKDDSSPGDVFQSLGSADDPDEAQAQRMFEMLDRRRAAERSLLERAQKHVVMRTLSNINLGIWDFD